MLLKGQLRVLWHASGLIESAVVITGLHRRKIRPSLFCLERELRALFKFVVGHWVLCWSYTNNNLIIIFITLIIILSCYSVLRMCRECHVSQSLPFFVGRTFVAVPWCGVYLNLEIGSGCVADVGWRSGIQSSSSSSSSAIPYHGYACNNSIIIFITLIIILSCYSVLRTCRECHVCQSCHSLLVACLWP